MFFFQGSGEEVQKYIVPMRLPPCSNCDSIYVQTAEDVVFYLDFCGFLPGEFGSWCELATRIPGCSCALCILQLYVKNVLSLVALQHRGLM